MKVTRIDQTPFRERARDVVALLAKLQPRYEKMRTQ